MTKNGVPGWLRFVLVAVAASAVGFAVHVADQSIVPQWVARQMTGVHSAGPPAGGVLVTAALSSIEIGIAYCVLYSLLRAATPNLNVLVRGLLLGILALALHGEFLRQPLMNAVIGNPFRVVLAMAAGPWLTSILTGVVLAIAYDRLVKFGYRTRG